MSCLANRARFVFFVLAFSSFGPLNSVGAQSDSIRGEFLGQSPPGVIPEPFGAGFFASYSAVHGRISFSPGGRELYWAANAAPTQYRWMIIMDESGQWTAPEPSWLALEFSENGLSITPDGRRAYFHSRRPLGASDSHRDHNIWYRERIDGRWSEPVPLGPTVNQPSTGEYQPALTEAGHLYFSREAEAQGPARGHRGQTTQMDIFHARLTTDGATESERLGPEVNSPYHEMEPAVPPDGSYLVFTSNRPGGFSPVMNLYVSFRRPDGSWSTARSLSEIFELNNIWFPSITPDGGYLFFCTSDYTENGIVGLYYWVDTNVIQRLRPENPGM